jgi:hypothetical protein
MEDEQWRGHSIEMGQTATGGGGERGRRRRIAIICNYVTEIYYCSSILLENMWWWERSKRTKKDLSLIESIFVYAGDMTGQKSKQPKHSS